MDLWEGLLEEYDEVLYIPMSSGLSSSCDTAMGLAMEFEGKVHVVNNQRISVTQRQSVLDAIEMAEKGMSVQEIEEVLMREKLESSIYVTVDTLKYLKKGGRITPAAAAIGTVLNLKPVLQIQGDKLDAFSKARGWKSAKKTMLDAMVPALAAMEGALKAAKDPKEILLEGVEAAEDGVAYTKTIIATKGRASYLGERSIGHQDPGATSFTLMLSVIAKSL